MRTNGKVVVGFALAVSLCANGESESHAAMMMQVPSSEPSASPSPDEGDGCDDSGHGPRAWLVRCIREVSRRHPGEPAVSEVEACIALWRAQVRHAGRGGSGGDHLNTGGNGPSNPPGAGGSSSTSGSAQNANPASNPAADTGGGNESRSNSLKADVKAPLVPARQDSGTNYSVSTAPKYTPLNSANQVVSAASPQYATKKNSMPQITNDRPIAAATQAPASVAKPSGQVAVSSAAPASTLRAQTQTQITAQAKSSGSYSRNACLDGEYLSGSSSDPVYQSNRASCCQDLKVSSAQSIKAGAGTRKCEKNVRECRSKMSCGSALK